MKIHSQNIDKKPKMMYQVNKEKHFDFDSLDQVAFLSYLTVFVFFNAVYFIYYVLIGQEK